MEPGSLTWVVVEDEDADVTVDGTGIAVTLGPLHAPIAPPMWWRTTHSPMGIGFDLPVQADTGTAHLAVNGSALQGKITLSGTTLTGHPTHYEATITATSVDDAPLLDRSSPISRNIATTAGGNERAVRLQDSRGVDMAPGAAKGDEHLDLPATVADPPAAGPSATLTGLPEMDVNHPATVVGTAHASAPPSPDERINAPGMECDRTTGIHVMRGGQSAGLRGVSSEERAGFASPGHGSAGLVGMDGLAEDAVKGEVTLSGNEDDPNDELRRKIAHWDDELRRAAGDEEPSEADADSVFARMRVLDQRISRNFVENDLAAMMAGLRDATALRREISFGELVTGAWERFLRDTGDTLAFDRQMVEALAAMSSGRLSLLLADSATDLDTSIELLSGLDRTPPDLDAFSGEVSSAAGELDRLATRLHEQIAKALAADLHIIDDNHPLRSARDDLLTLLASAGSPEDLDLREQHWERDLATAIQPTPGHSEVTEPASADSRFTGSASLGAEEAAVVLLVKNVAVVLVGAVARVEHCHEQLRRLDPVGNATFVRASNADAIARLGRYVERWRGRLESDWERILMMEEARELHGQLVGTMLDLGAPIDALAASEMARARAFADLMTGRKAAPALTPARMEALLADYESPIVEYFRFGDRLIIFVTDLDGRVHTVDQHVDHLALRALAGELQHWFRVTKVDDVRTRELLRALGEILWDPIAHLLPTDPDIAVTLVPHDELLSVPLHALIDAEGRYLVERHTTTVLPAASILPPLLARRTGMGKPTRICALVDPEPMPVGYRPLPILRGGFRVVSELFAEAEIHAGADATEDALVAGASRGPGVLCLATHAEALPSDPMASFVALASGKLTADVVHGMELPVALVVLAACETGGGQVTGDGVIGLSRAFLSAGPVAVLMTLWPVVERDSLRVLRRFHETHLNTPLGTAQALREAQCSMIAGSAAPRSWAAFTLFGLAR
ncbi:hypothetical protein Aph01nite_69460 [Acrocarpospora phusangensis]|uniref:CHAT domain-containing protein n=2 Tax=Acrocarpospora phusangensis TaxID=1070424 RepID=A0A919UNL4_9ACTN|nr:hypothetical protein Aph01nite_69460 [Acrocarpospora phusangensis]